MTALGGDTVERTFSAVGRYSAGLPGPKTHEAGGQDLGDFSDPFVRLKDIWCNSHCGKMNEIYEMSRCWKGITKTNEPTRTGAKSNELIAVESDRLN